MLSMSTGSWLLRDPNLKGAPRKKSTFSCPLFRPENREMPKRVRLHWHWVYKSRLLLTLNVELLLFRANSEQNVRVSEALNPLPPIASYDKVWGNEEEAALPDKLPILNSQPIN